VPPSRTGPLLSTIGALAWLICGAFCGPLQAHELPEGVGTQSTFRLFSDRLEFELNLGFSAAAGFPVLMSLDGSGPEDSKPDDQISVKEAQILIDERGRALLPQLDLFVNGIRLDLQIVSAEEVGLRGTIMVKSFDIYYQVIAKFPEDSLSITAAELLGGDYWLHYHDRSFENQTSSQINWLAYEGHGESFSGAIFQPADPPLNPEAADIGFRCLGREFVVSYNFSGQPAGDPSRDAITPLEALQAQLPPEQISEGRDEAPRQLEQREASDGIPIVESPRPPPVLPENSEQTEEEEIGEIVGEIARGERSFGEILFALLLAVLFGAGHALGPGHGKTMVAAYLVGTKGRVRDAITLGAVVTFAHTFSVFLLGLLLLYLIEKSQDKAIGATYQNWITTGFSLLSGLFLFVFGLILLRRRIRVAQGKASAHSHSHGWWSHSHPHLGGHHGHHHHHDHHHEPSGDHHHEHDHEHTHDHHHEHGHEHTHQHPAPASAHTSSETEGVRFRDLLALGFSGGIVPCPAGFTIILVAAHYGALALGLLILVFFSFGLGALLCLIGVGLTLGKAKIFDRLGNNSRRLVQWLPVGSAAFVALLGIGFMVRTYGEGKTEVAQMLRALANQIGG